MGVAGALGATGLGWCGGGKCVGGGVCWEAMLRVVDRLEKRGDRTDEYKTHLATLELRAQELLCTMCVCVCTMCVCTMCVQCVCVEGVCFAQSIESRVTAW